MTSNIDAWITYKLLNWLAALGFKDKGISIQITNLLEGRLTVFEMESTPLKQLLDKLDQGKILTFGGKNYL